MTNKKPYKGKIPFSNREFDKGNLVDYVHPVCLDSPDIEWRENYTFGAALEFLRFYRGRSAANAIFRHAGTSYEYQMFLTDLKDLLKSHTVYAGTVAAYWTFCKRGTNYGIKLVE